MTRNNKFGSADARDQVAARDLVRAYGPRGSSGSPARQPLGAPSVKSAMDPAKGHAPAVTMHPLQAGQQVWRIRDFSTVGRSLGIDGCLQRRRHRQWRSRGS